MIHRLSDSRERQIQKFLNELQLGHKKPSQLFREMQELGGDYVHSNFIRSRFIQCMPSRIRAFLVDSADLTLEKLADTADRLLESCGSSFIMATEQASGQSTPSVSAVEGRLTLLERSVERILTSIDKLITRVDNLHTDEPIYYNNRSNSYSQRRSRSRSRSRSTQSSNGVCYYHARFATDAKHCLHFRQVLPFQYSGCELKPSALKLFAANSTKIPTFGTKMLVLDLGLPSIPLALHHH